MEIFCIVISYLFVVLSGIIIVYFITSLRPKIQKLTLDINKLEGEVFCHARIIQYKSKDICKFTSHFSQKGYYNILKELIEWFVISFLPFKKVKNAFLIKKLISKISSLPFKKDLAN